MRIFIYNLCFVFLAVLFSALDDSTSEADQVIPGEFIVEPSTLICLGFEWYIEGDENINAVVQVQYRTTGSKEWKDYIPLLRIPSEKAGTPEWNYMTPNMFAGSIMNLAPGTEYECRFTLSDPDGVKGESVKMVKVKTREEPKPHEKGRIRHVYPENWKDEKKEPAYDGLLHAYYGYPRFADWTLTADPVQPGDAILVHAGEYKADYTDYRDYHGVTFDGTYYFTQDGNSKKLIVIKAAGDGEVVFDGNGTSVLFDLTDADYHYIEGITLKNTKVAIRAGLMNAYGCNGLTVKNCFFKDIGIGIQGRFEGSKHYYIADNTFIGREDTNMVFHHKLEDGRHVQRIRSYYAVKLHGQGHVVCYNRVKYFFDGIDICTHARPEIKPQLKSVAIDFYNNDIFVCNDNFIEADGGNHNIRILRNRCFNSGQQALSNQPVLGGPVYWIRNMVYNAGDISTFKFWGMNPAGILAFHNTSSNILTRVYQPGTNIQMYNNLFLPSKDNTEPSLGMNTTSNLINLDYNGYRFYDPFIGWKGSEENRKDIDAVTYNSLDDFMAATGQEEHGIIVDYDIFNNAYPPDFKEFQEKHKALGRAYPVYYPEEFDFGLSKNAKAIDAGIVLPGINDNYIGKKPDLGALEFGQKPPHYGPRMRQE